MEVISCTIALLSLIVTYIVYHNNSIADVVVYAQVDLARPTMINLVIHNIGKGIARDIQFVAEQGIPKQANGISKLTDKKEIYTNGAFVNGLPFLFPDEKLIYSWGQLGGLKEALSNQPLDIKVIFRSKLALQLWSRQLANNLKIDINSLEGISISEPVLHTEIKNKLEKIAAAITKLK